MPGGYRGAPRQSDPNRGTSDDEAQDRGSLSAMAGTDRRSSDDPRAGGADQ